MIALSKGLINSLIVLEYLRNNEELKEYDVNVGTFTNCRECGLTFIICGFKDDTHNWHMIDAFTFCVYEHRNSDEIIINGKKGCISLNGDLPYAGDNKYTFLASFSYNQHYECADKLIELIKNHVTINLAAKKKEAKTK